MANKIDKNLTSYHAWFVQNCKHLLGWPPYWPYTKAFEEFCDKFRKDVQRIYSNTWIQSECGYLFKHRNDIQNPKFKIPDNWPPHGRRLIMLDETTMGYLIDAYCNQPAKLIRSKYPLTVHSGLAYSSYWEKHIYPKLDEMNSCSIGDAWVVVASISHKLHTKIKPVYGNG